VETGIVRQPQGENLQRHPGFLMRQDLVNDKGLRKSRKDLENVTDFDIG
jgi:hypothetical protein